MAFDDAGLNIPELPETLVEQQRQLVEGMRPAQMFPKGTPELPLPDGFARAETHRGIFHFNPRLVSRYGIHRASSAERENEILALGPYNKADVIRRMNAGEVLFVVTERTADGIEVKAAAGTQSTAPVQIAVFESTKSIGSGIGVETVEQVLMRRMSYRAAELGKAA